VYSDRLREERWDLGVQRATGTGIADWRRRNWRKSIQPAIAERNEALTALEAEGKEDKRAAFGGYTGNAMGRRGARATFAETLA